jgi:hypothetical protein
MRMKQHIVLGIHITDRLRRAEDVQRVLTEHGRLIRTRLGLHETDRRAGSPNGLLLLELVDDPAGAAALARSLRRIRGIAVKSMVFGHP